MGTAKMTFASQGKKTPLVVRASLPRTFWILGIFAEASLLFTGFCFLAEATLRPLEASLVSILSAVVILALALILWCTWCDHGEKRHLPEWKIRCRPQRWEGRR
jgi:hypothetical protein